MKIKLQPDVKIDAKAIEADIRKFVDVCCSTIAKEATDLINKFAFQEMVEYYNEYDPYYYDRTYQIILQSYRPYWSHTGSSYEGGIIINSNFTDHQPKGITESQIYDEVWEKGRHGWERIKYASASGNVDYWRPIQGEVDRIGRLKQQAYSTKTKQFLIDKGIKAARNVGGYSILKFNRR